MFATRNILLARQLVNWTLQQFGGALYAHQMLCKNKLGMDIACCQKVRVPTTKECHASKCIWNCMIGYKRS